MATSTDPKRELLRHAVATLAYRGGKAVRGTPSEFSDFHAGPSTRTPGQILAHIGDLLDWALSIAQGKQQWQDSEPLPWNQQIDRFFAALKVFETYLASTEELIDLLVPGQRFGILPLLQDSEPLPWNQQIDRF